MGVALIEHPTVSAIIPCYNRADILPTAIESALSQDYRPLEVVVVDDGSSDGSVDVAASYDVTVVASEHLGPAGIRNIGVAASNGEYIAFLDTDDVWTQGSLSRRMEIFARDPEIGLVFADAGVIDTNSGDLTGRYFRGRSELEEMETEALGDDAYLVWSDPVPFVLKRSFILTSTAIVSRRAWDLARGFDESLQIAEDLDLWVRVAEHCPFAYTTSMATLYHRHEDSLTLKRRLVTLGLFKVWTKLRDRYVGVYPDLRGLLDSTLGSWAYKAGVIAVSENDRPLARECFATALKCMPAYKSAWVGYLRTIVGW